MSLTVDGVWKAGVWATTVWGDGVWFEGERASVTTSRGGPARTFGRYYYRVTIDDKTFNVKAENLDEFIKSKLRKALKKPVDRVQARRVQKQEEPQVIQELPVYRELAKSNDADIQAALVWAVLELAIEMDDEEILPLLIH